MRSVSRWLAARARRTVADWRRMRLRRDPRLLEDGHEFKRRTEREGIPTHSVDSGTANHLPQPRGFPGQVPQQGRMGRGVASDSLIDQPEERPPLEPPGGARKVRESREVKRGEMKGEVQRPQPVRDARNQPPTGPQNSINLPHPAVQGEEVAQES